MEIAAVCCVVFLTTVIAWYSRLGYSCILMPVLAVMFPLPTAIMMVAIVQILTYLPWVPGAFRNVDGGYLLATVTPSAFFALFGAFLLFQMEDNLRYQHPAPPKAQAVTIAGNTLPAATKSSAGASEKNNLKSVVSFEFRSLQVSIAILIFCFLIIDFVIMAANRASQPMLFEWLNQIFGRLPLIPAGMTFGFIKGFSGFPSAFVRNALLRHPSIPEHSRAALPVLTAFFVDITRLLSYCVFALFDPNIFFRKDPSLLFWHLTQPQGAWLPAVASAATAAFLCPRLLAHHQKRNIIRNENEQFNLYTLCMALAWSMAAGIAMAMLLGIV